MWRNIQYMALILKEIAEIKEKVSKAKASKSDLEKLKRLLDDLWDLDY